MMRLFLLCSALFLAGCSLFEKDDPRACPRMSILNDAARVAVYRDGPGRDLIDVMHEGQIGDIGWSCEYGESQVNVLATISFLAQRGPASDRPEASFNYFVAITSDGEEILAKKIFTTVVQFSPGLSQAGVFEEIEQIIPLPDPEAGPNYEIIVGFQLSKEQLKQSRKRRRF